MDRGVTTDIQQNEGGYEHMPCSSPPRLSQPFVLECDASRVGIGAVLMQGGHPIVFESRKLNETERLYPIYDKEMLAIMHALTKFRQYLVGNRFVVKIDHNSLLELGKQSKNLTFLIF